MNGAIEDVIFGMLVTEVVAAACLGILIHLFYRRYGKAYLGHWALSWLALMGFVAASAVLLSAPGSELAAFAVPVQGATGYLHVGLLVLGFWEFTRGRQARWRFITSLVVVLAVAGLTVPSLAQLAGGGTGLAIAEIGQEGISGVVLAAVAIWMFRRRQPEHGISLPLASGSLFIYGLHNVNAAVYHYIELNGGQFPLHDHWLAYIALPLQCLLGVAMVSALLEEERNAARLATQEIERVAYHDSLTGLPNRPLFLDRLIIALAQGARHGYKVAVFFLDVDHFKDINDTLGHSHGDALLKELAERIRRCVRAGDTVGRFGGDEFTVFVQDIDRIEDIARVAEKLLATVKQPFRIGGQDLFVSVSVGISFFPVDGSDPETLLKNADVAMYRAKEQGRATYQIYAPAMNARAVERLSLESRLRGALEANQLELWYQPLVMLETRVMYGAEALLRWRTNDGRVATPREFIRALESSELILPVGDWILRRACSDAVAWSKTGRSLSVSVNLAPRQFQRPDLASRVAAILEETHLDPRLLEVEITENAAMQNAETSMRALQELKQLGIRVALDDFGVGYSSLNYLKRFPIDCLKVDRSFISDVTEDPGDAAIATAIISMARSLELSVVAEGIETEEQLAFLRGRGCYRGQGFLFARALPVDEFTELLERGPVPLGNQSLEHEAV
jgi:diguanylate cyclase (GGDEF)-like protein